MSRPAVFLDRDGTISEEVGYVNHLSRYRLLPRSLEAIRLFNEAGYLTVVITNQAGVARGYFTEDLIGRVHERLLGWATEAGARIDAVYYCAHHPREGQPPYRADCECRKPRPGMIRRALREHDIDPQRSYVVGDSWIDIEAGAAVGMPGLLVLTGYGRGLLEYQKDRFRTPPVHVADDLLAAARWILRHGRTPDDRHDGEER